MMKTTSFLSMTVFGLAAFISFGAYFLYFTFLSLGSYSTEYSLDLIAGLFFAVGIAALTASFFSMVFQGNLRALVSRAGMLFWLLLAITLVFVPVAGSNSSFRVNCGPINYGPNSSAKGNYTPEIQIYRLNSPLYSSLGMGVTYGAYFTANPTLNGWPIDGFRLVAWNNTLAGTYDPPLNYCP